MARKKKISEENDEIYLSEDEVWDVLEFSRALLNGVYPSVYSPEAMNRLMKDVSYSPRKISEDELERALDDVKNNEETIRNYVEYVENTSSLLRRLFHYLSSLPALDLLFTVTNVSDPKEYNSKAFKKDKEKVFRVLDRFDIKFEFRKAIRQLLRNEVFAFTLRDEGQRIVLQELPLSFTKITARYDYGFLISFDFSFFLRNGTSLDMYHPFFKKKFKELFADGKNQNTYNPNLPPDKRGSSHSVLWVDVPPEAGMAFKLDPSLITASPLTTPMLRDLINQDVMRKLQKDSDISSAFRLLLGEVPLLKDAKANVKDMIAIDPATLGRFLNLVRSSLSNAIKIASAPLENMKAISFDQNKGMYDDWMRTTLASSGFDTALLYSNQVKANLIDSQLSFQSDSKILEQLLYPQFASLLDWYINTKITSKYHYKFIFEGNDFYLDRQQRFDRANTLADKGIVLPQLFASALGIMPQDFQRMMEETDATGFVEKLKPLIPGSQTPKDAGRPAKSESELGEAGAQTREAGGNENRQPI